MRDFGFSVVVIGEAEHDVEGVDVAVAVAGRRGRGPAPPAGDLLAGAGKTSKNTHF